MAVLVSSIHYYNYHPPCQGNFLGRMAAAGPKAPRFNRLSVPAIINSWIELERRYCSSSSVSNKKLRIFSVRSKSETTSDEEKTPFGYTRKDVLLIGLGLTAFGIGLKYGLELIGVDSLKAGNVVQLVMVLGLTVGWVFTYIFRVSTKDMTYAQQLRDYENKVMQVHLTGLHQAQASSTMVYYTLCMMKDSFLHMKMKKVKFKDDHSKDYFKDNTARNKMKIKVKILSS